MSLNYNSDIPFIKSLHLEAQIRLMIINEGVNGGDVSCTCGSWHAEQKEPTVFSGAFLPFLLLLDTLNREITEINFGDEKKSGSYWISLRSYLNMVLVDSLSRLGSKLMPEALALWLHREFMMCRHDDLGRHSYLKLMRSNGLQPFQPDIFILGFNFFLLPVH
jgi:hypothetical protein